MKVLLINPAVYDTRFHWARWHSPTLLPRIAGYFRARGDSVSGINLVPSQRGYRTPRRRVTVFNVDGIAVPQWRFGRSAQWLVRELEELARSGWKPKRVFVECLTTFWWQGAEEAVRLVRARFPGVKCAIVGGYAMCAPAHVYRRVHAAPVTTVTTEVATAHPDWTVEDLGTRVAQIATAGGTRESQDVFTEVQLAAAAGIGLVALSEPGLGSRSPDLLSDILTRIARANLDVRLIVTGALSPYDFVANRGLARALRAARCIHVFFADDRAIPMDDATADQLVDAYTETSALCAEAGYTLRTDALNGAVCLGRPGEDLAQRARLITRVAGAIGTVVTWPYQPSPQEHRQLCGEAELHEQNGKLFPFRHVNGATYRDYLNVQGLAVVLNAKYRERTFDFLGPGLIPVLFRNSLERRAWDPDPSVKGDLRVARLATS